jgi:hypothetical protein
MARQRVQRAMRRYRALHVLAGPPAHPVKRIPGFRSTW